MNQLTLWGRKNSANVQKALWALGELGLDYQHIPLGGSFGGLDAPDYRALNPNGLVPTLRDGDLVVWESMAIVRYLAAQYGADTLWRVTPAERAVVDQWTDWGIATFQPAWISVFWNAVRVPKAEQDAELIARGVAHANTVFAILDRQLHGRDYVAGDFSCADIQLGIAMYRWMTMDIARAEMPHVAAWYQRLRQRPAYAASVMVSYAELVGRRVA